MGASKNVGGKDESTLMSFRVGKTTKTDFDQICKERSELGSEVLRELVEQWIEKQRWEKGYGRSENDEGPDPG